MIIELIWDLAPFSKLWIWSYALTAEAKKDPKQPFCVLCCQPMLLSAFLFVLVDWLKTSQGLHFNVLYICRVKYFIWNHGRENWKPDFSTLSYVASSPSSQKGSIIEGREHSGHQAVCWVLTWPQSREKKRGGHMLQNTTTHFHCFFIHTVGWLAILIGLMQ